MIKPKKVILGMSGGVDSSVSAYLLLKNKYIVEGVFMKNWEEDDKFNYCSALEDLNDARNVCKFLGIHLHEINFSHEYWNYVFKDFISVHKKGNTPNPDILCNQKIKFGVFFDFSMKQLNSDYIATGHYAQISYFNHKPMLLRSTDLLKDQTYFLYTLKHYQLKKILFPIGHLKKYEVRNIAKKINLLNSQKKDSFGICFIGPRKMSNFLNRFIRSLPGNIVTIHGYIIGIHTGLVNYTIGQRKGLGIGGKNDKKLLPWYVMKKNLFKNSLIVVQGHQNNKLFSIGLIARNVNWINKDNVLDIFKCTLKTRYRQKDISCKITLLNLRSVKAIFSQPVSSVTIGQSVVFYQYDICLGGGIITSSIPYYPDSKID
ncbi:tRNA-specific 2-thiouridylase MnmA [Buchnera aphidicola (Panaphis juglandis)]